MNIVCIRVTRREKIAVDDAKHTKVPNKSSFWQIWRLLPALLSFLKLFLWLYCYSFHREGTCLKVNYLPEHDRDATLKWPFLHGRQASSSVCPLSGCLNFGGQEWQDLEATSGPNVPTGHGMHSAAGERCWKHLIFAQKNLLYIIPSFPGSLIILKCLREQKFLVKNLAIVDKNFFNKA